MDKFVASVYRALTMDFTGMGGFNIINILVESTLVSRKCKWKEILYDIEVLDFTFEFYEKINIDSVDKCQKAQRLLE